jgi:Leucine-rich repeat (LRR) protein
MSERRFTIVAVLILLFFSVSTRTPAAETSKSLAAPNDPKLDELVQGAFRFIEIRLRTPGARGHFYWQDDPWEPQNSARRGDSDDEYATHMPLYQVLEPLPVDLCFKVEFHLEETDEVYEGVSFVVPKGQQVHGRYFSVDNTPNFVEGRNGFIPLRIVLTPSQEVALNDTRVTQYYNGTLTSGLLRAKAYWFQLSSAKTWERELKTMFQKLENKKHINKQVLHGIKAVTSLNPHRRLIKLLSGTDTFWEIQAATRAEDALVAIGTPTVEPLIDAVKDENPDVREAAAYLLGTIADRRAVNPLIKALGDSEKEVRWAAAFALGEIKDPRAIAPLTAALYDYDNLVRDNAATALKLINYELKLKENYEAVVHFSDPNLERKIRAAIGKPTGQIKGADLVGVGFTELKAWASQIKDLTGLEYCTDLTILWLSNNQIQDINSLSDLVKLVNLRLEGNQIRDISALTELTKLERLNLSKNQIVDISPLAGCNNLTNIWIMGNQITDLAPLSGLSSLKGLDIDKNQLRDVSPLAELKKLTVLNAASNQIADISQLSRLTKMTYLYLSGNQIADISPLQQMANLRILKLKHNQISDLSPLSKLPKLYSLEVSNNPIENIETIESLRNLQYLRIGSCHIGDIDSFSELTKLKNLILTKNPISDISPLSSLENLSYLRLDHCQISDIDPLGGLTNLKGLHLCHNEINDISVLSELTSLEHIWLEKNLIIDIRPLVENKGISKGTSINLGDNPLSDESVKIHIPALQARGVKVFCVHLVRH